MIKPQRRIMDTVPSRRFKNIGYGFIPISSQQWELRINAIKNVMNVMESCKFPCSQDVNTINDLKIVKGLFLSVLVGDQWDWFTTSRMLGFPSSDLSKKMSLRFHRMGSAILADNESFFKRCTTDLEKNYIYEMMDSYLSIACDSKHPVEEEGWAYILWSSSAPDELYIGASGGQIDEVTRQLRMDNPGYDPYGVLAAWLVHDPVEAYQDIKKKFNNCNLGGGFYEHKLGDAREIITNLLETTDNYALSPWHGEVVNETEDEVIKIAI